MKKITRAGTIPYVIEDDEIVMYFMKPSDAKYGGCADGIARFQVAKGKMEPEDDHYLETAIREAEEELGLIQDNIKGEVSYLGNYLGRTKVYICRVKDKILFNEPHFETGETAWMTEEQFLQDGRPLHHYIIQDAVQKIKQLEKL